MMVQRVLIADTQEIAIEGIKHILQQEDAFEWAGEVAHAQELEKKLYQLQPAADILVFDYHQLPGASLSFYQQLQAAHPALKTFIISADNNRQNILKYLEIGVSAFLTKDCSKEEVLHAFQALAKEQKFYCNRVLDLLVENKFTKNTAHARPQELNEREMQILQHIADGFSTQEMASQLFLSPHTINAYRKSILKKMEVKTPVEMIAKAFRSHLIPLA